MRVTSVSKKRYGWRTAGCLTLLVLSSAAAAVPATSSAQANLADSPLVTTQWLADNLQRPDLRVIEVSVNPGLYERAHIPGAVNFSWHNDLNDPLRRDIVSQSNFEALLSKAGVQEGSTVVLYGDNNNWFASWGAWVFEVYGVPQVKLLDGGRQKWEAESRPLDNRIPEYQTTDYRVTQPQPQLRARLADALDVAEGRSPAKLVDIRSADEFQGRIFAPAGFSELAIRAGHIPGAVNVPWVQAVQADGSFKSKEELRQLYAAVGIDGTQPVITYCRIGERSSHTWFALSQILGYEVKNYDGSWTEYGNAVGLPISNPAGTVWAAN